MNAADDRRKAGVFLLVSLGLLLLLAGTLAGVRFLSRDRAYTAEFLESVAGLEPSSPVKLNGVPVGSVVSIHFSPEDVSRIHVRFKVRPETPMKVGTRATLQPQGITGIFYLELRGGSSAAGDLEPGDLIPSDPSLSTKIANIARDLSELVSRLNSFAAKNEENLSYAIADFRASAGSIRDTLEKANRLIEKAGTVVDGGGEVVAEARKAIEDARSEVHETGGSIRQAVRALEDYLENPDLVALPAKAGKTMDLVNERLASADFTGLIRKATDAVDDFRRIEQNLDRAAEALARTSEGGQRDVGAALADIRTAAGHVKEATRLLKEDPGRILRSRPSSEKSVPEPMTPLPEDHR